MKLSAARFVIVDGTEVRVTAKSSTDGRIALKELRQKKREYALQRRAIQYRLRLARDAQRQAERSSAGAARRGGVSGFLGRLLARRAVSVPLASVEGIEEELHACDEILFNLESCKVQVEGLLLAAG